ncbi:methylcrotonyl-CoA carboxylase subunit alpha [Bacteroidales bacterium]
MKINKVLIANRGEIAIRIIRSLKQKGIVSVVVYAANDQLSLHVKEADEAWPLSGEGLRETYLNIDQIIHIALQSKADAIHPGYGFLSENPLFAETCQKSGLVFIGPSAETIRLMGDKVQARETARKFELPVTKGLTGDVESLLAESHTLNFPVLVKAAAGGGGKGMRIVRQPSELAAVLEATTREAGKYFGNATVYLEEFIENPRHIEIQVLADQHGNVVHLGERECSIQRRYQKIIEEAPSPTIHAETRKKMGQAAVNLCKGIGYQSAGTIEFLFSPDGHFYFLEMNTRIQVEHPVTELVTGIDLVTQQLRIAQGELLDLRQSDIVQNGHAIECRIYAEDPLQGFVPSPGEIVLYREPKNQHLRLDSAFDTPGTVSADYDPMIAKIISYGSTRYEAIERLSNGLREYAIHGIKTNIPYLSALLSHEAFRNNHVSTAFCELHAKELSDNIRHERETTDIAVPAAAFLLLNPGRLHSAQEQNVWKSIGYWRSHMQFNIRIEQTEHQVGIDERRPEGICFRLNNRVVEAGYIGCDNGILRFSIDGVLHTAFISTSENHETLVQLGVHSFYMQRSDQFVDDDDYSSEPSEKGGLFSPMPGKVIKVAVESGQIVERGSLLVIVEAMKMENNLTAPYKSRVQTVCVKEGDMVDTKTQLIHLEDID